MEEEEGSASVYQQPEEDEKLQVKNEQPSSNSQLSGIDSEKQFENSNGDEDKLQEKNEQPSLNGQSKIDDSEGLLKVASEEEEASLPEALIVVAHDTIDAPSMVAEEAVSIIALDGHAATSPIDDVIDSPPAVAYQVPHDSIFTFAEDAPIDAPFNNDEDAPLMLPEDLPSTVAEGAPSMMYKEVAEEAPIDAPPIDAEDDPSIVSQEKPPVIAEEAASMVAEYTPPIIDEESPIEEAPKLVAEGALSKVSADAPPMVAENESPVVDEDASPMVDKDAFPIVDEGETSPGVVEDASPMIDEGGSSPRGYEDTSPMVTDDAAHVSEVDTEMEAEMELETEVVETGSSGRKRKRGRPARVQAKAPTSKKTEEEEVCFICFDGGNLVLCDRRGCPKAYHPACVNRDEAFFRSKGRWNCGWHICSNCEKAAHFMCYTCTYSLCKGCIKEGDFLSVRGNKGLCGTCMRTIMLIEKNEQANTEMAQVDFDDKSTWEYLFKEYWIDLKENQSLTPDELTHAKNSSRGSNTFAPKDGSSEDLYDANDDKGSDSDGSPGHLEVGSSKRRKAKRRPKSSKDEEPPSITRLKSSKENEASSVAHAVGEGMSLPNDTEWASKDLLEFVAHMKNGDKSVLSQFEVQALLLDYIKLNDLRDPRRKSQIVCDSRLVNLFGKARVGHFEMLKLLESHFLVKEDTHADDIQSVTADAEANQLDGEGNAVALTKAFSDKRRKSRKKGDGRGPQTNLDDYAAVDVHNIKLLYLRRNLMEDLLEDSDKFNGNVVGSFVRIRISGSGQKHDMYRLVQVVGTRKAAEPYKTGKRSADVVLETLNLNKAEVISIDTISNQEFTEDECKRLRQSIKCGLISRMTVGEVQEKSMTLQAVRVDDWLEMEKLRISHLRDRASEQGRRKDLRECVEKLQLLNTPEERLRRLQEFPEVHADPKMDPNYESEEDEEIDDRAQEKSMMTKDDGFSRKGRDPISPGKGSPASVDTWSGARKIVNGGSDPGKNISTIGVWDRGYGANGTGDLVGSDSQQLNSWEKPKILASAIGLGTSASSGQAAGRSGQSPGNSQEPAAPLPADIVSNICESDKVWHYQDPSGKIQGPFSMVQLRKWSTTGHFPVDLRIWRATEKQEESILLNDALDRKYNRELPQKGNTFSPPEKVATLSEYNREANWGSGWDGSSNTTWTDNNRIDRTSSSNWKDSSGFANGSDAWGPGSSGWAAPTKDSKGEQPGHLLRGGWDPRRNNAWADRPVHSPHLSSSYSQPQRPTSHQGGQSGGRWNRGQNRGNNWNSNRYRGPQSNTGHGYDARANNMAPSGHTWGENWISPPENSTRGWNTVEAPKSVTGGWDHNQSNKNNLPSPTPNSTRTNWTEASENKWSPTPASFENKWSPTPVASIPANVSASSKPPSMGSNGVQSSPIRLVNPNETASGWTDQRHLSVVPLTAGEWGPSAWPASVPMPVETLNQDVRVDFSNPPTPTPVSAAGNHVHP